MQDPHLSNSCKKLLQPNCLLLIDHMHPLERPLFNQTEAENQGITVAWAHAACQMVAWAHAACQPKLLQSKTASHRPTSP